MIFMFYLFIMAGRTFFRVLINVSELLDCEFILSSEYYYFLSFDCMYVSYYISMGFSFWLRYDIVFQITLEL